MGLTYRMHTTADEPALIQLWSDHGGWDTVDVESWAHRLLRPPLGPASIAVTTDTDTGEIVGQFAFVPSLVSIDGHEVPALRPFAPIVAKSARGFHSINPLDHPVPAMYRHAVKAMRARGGGLIYMLPNWRWMRLFRLFPMLQCGSFPLWSLPVPLAAPLPLGDGYAIGQLTAWDERVDRLWIPARQQYGCLVVRDSRTLPWKIGSFNYTVTTVERDGELIGLVAAHRKGDRQWLICDLLAVDAEDSLRATVIAAVQVAHAEAVAAHPEHPIRKVSLLVTPVMEPCLRALGFIRDAYDFPLVVQVLDPAITKEGVAPGRWYLSAND